MSAEKIVRLNEEDLLCVVGGSGEENDVPSLVSDFTVEEESVGSTRSSGTAPEPVSDDDTFLGGLKYGFLKDGALGTLNYMRERGVDRWTFGCLIADVIKLLPVLGAGYLLAKFNQPSKRPKKKK